MKKLLIIVMIAQVISGCVTPTSYKAQCLESPQPRKYVEQPGNDACYEYIEGKWVFVPLNIHYNEPAKNLFK